jgi:EAL domain-containing protein (putative c-di-GMP-specific phosphodiesterase class I)
MTRVASQAQQLVAGAEGVLIGLADAEEITYVYGSGYLGAHAGVRTLVDSSIGGLSVRTGEVLRCDDTETDPRVDREVCRRLGTRAAVVVPLARGADVFGVLAVGATRPGAFSDDDVAVLGAMADLMSVAVAIAGDLARCNIVLSSFVDGESLAVAGDPGADSAARFLLTVLDPGSLALVDARQRVQAVLEDPSDPAMVFQSIVDLETGSVAGVEALARFRAQPIRPPNDWFVEADQVGLGVELELAAIRRAVAALPDVGEAVWLTVNAGPDLIASPALHEVLAATGRPERIVVELTEHTPVDDYELIGAALRKLRRSGVRVAVDDTGAGFASLAHILKLAPDFIKLDRELISGIDFDPVRRALATALASFAAETGARIIAEGVETEDELAVVRALGVRFAQGFHLGRPTDLDRALRASARSGRPS